MQDEVLGPRRVSQRNPVELFIETILFNSRWLLAPFYLALVAVLVVLLVKMGQQLVHFIISAPQATETDVILEALSLIDLTLMGSLVIIVIFSGYENFVSKIDEADHKDWPEWMGKIDFAGLKLKLLSSIVAISAVKLLSAFMKVKSYDDRELMWSVGIHVVFVVSGLFMAWTDKISGEH
ncbi:MAG: TIGR00645 family protein [Beijerinckiaceae bacterium]